MEIEKDEVLDWRKSFFLILSNNILDIFFSSILQKQVKNEMLKKIKNKD